ncbi:MAG: hypothetical protein ACLUD2_12450 [Clostridium sp.]
MWNPNHPDYEKDKVWTVARFAPGQHGEQIMLEGAERTAISEHVTKEEQDFWVLESHHRAAKGCAGAPFIGHPGFSGGKL